MDGDNIRPIGSAAAQGPGDTLGDAANIGKEQSRCVSLDFPLNLIEQSRQKSAFWRDITQMFDAQVPGASVQRGRYLHARAGATKPACQLAKRRRGRRETDALNRSRRKGVK